MGQQSPRVPCAAARTPPCHHSCEPWAFRGKQHPHTLTLPAQRLSADPSTWVASSGCRPSGTEVQHPGPASDLGLTPGSFPTLGTLANLGSCVHAGRG